MSTTEDTAMSDQEFFDEASPLGDRDTRREAINDYASNAEDELSMLKYAVVDNDLARARKKLEELKGWIDAIDDNLCERDENGARRDD